MESNTKRMRVQSISQSQSLIILLAMIWKTRRSKQSIYSKRLRFWKFICKSAQMKTSRFKKVLLFWTTLLKIWKNSQKLSKNQNLLIKMLRLLMSSSQRKNTMMRLERWPQRQKWEKQRKRRVASSLSYSWSSKV